MSVAVAGGRPTKRTPDVEAALEAAFTKGMPVRIACELVGIGVSTYEEWREKFPEFTERMDRARASGVERALTAIQNQQDVDWRAGEAFLRLSRPSEFGRNAIDITVGGKVDHVHMFTPTPEFLARVLENVGSLTEETIIDVPRIEESHSGVVQLGEDAASRTDAETMVRSQPLEANGHMPITEDGVEEFE